PAGIRPRQAERLVRPRKDRGQEHPAAGAVPAPASRSPSPASPPSSTRPGATPTPSPTPTPAGWSPPPRRAKVLHRVRRHPHETTGWLVVRRVLDAKRPAPQDRHKRPEVVAINANE